MNLIGLDYGQKNIGIALSVVGIVQPVAVLKNNDDFYVYLTNLISQYKVEKIILGYTNSPNLSQIKKFSTNLEQLLPVELVEESTTTRQATEIIKINRNYHKKYLKEPVDSVAACLILQRYLG